MLVEIRRSLLLPVAAIRPIMAAETLQAQTQSQTQTQSQAQAEAILIAAALDDAVAASARRQMTQICCAWHEAKM